MSIIAKFDADDQLLMRRIVLKVFTREEMLSLPEPARQKVELAAVKELAKYKSRLRRSEQREKARSATRKPSRDSVKAVTARAKKIAEDVWARERAEREQAAYRRDPHCYWGS
ncbi:hypothetical protein J7426_01560 [Tropicibacter sp. R16_0]|uniref:hypothetical protein n=1 Tax=Tropicibacter sp. R16_0 TaxID=2821102 RepID=UPI001ADA655A|nr:hypothetical protein [Tropicibacter sp. R16_0]MBO9448924.1 hypothetical protein [Tropicibacter sp. R16_0]